MCSPATHRIAPGHRGGPNNTCKAMQVVDSRRDHHCIDGLGNSVVCLQRLPLGKHERTGTTPKRCTSCPVATAQAAPQLLSQQHAPLVEAIMLAVPSLDVTFFPAVRGLPRTRSTTCCSRKGLERRAEANAGVPRPGRHRRHGQVCKT